MCSFVNISQVIGWEGWVFCTSQEIGSKMVCDMSNVPLNFSHLNSFASENELGWWVIILAYLIIFYCV